MLVQFTQRDNFCWIKSGASWNCPKCVNIFKEGTNLRVCKMKSEKSLNHATGRMKNTQFKRGEIVLFECIICFCQCDGVSDTVSPSTTVVNGETSSKMNFN